MVLARSDNCHPWARAGRVKVAAGRGARRARNLDQAEHARTIAGRSGRSYSPQHRLTLRGLRRTPAVAQVRSQR